MEIYTNAFSFENGKSHTLSLCASSYSFWFTNHRLSRTRGLMDMQLMTIKPEQCRVQAPSNYFGECLEGWQDVLYFP